MIMMFGPLYFSLTLGIFCFVRPVRCAVRGTVGALGVVASLFAPFVPPSVASQSTARLEYQPALVGLDYGKTRSSYPDFVQTSSGLQYKVTKPSTRGGDTAKEGDRVVVDWEGYTIGYYGRPFQARNKVKGGAFANPESDYFRWVVGSGNAIGALDECVRYLHAGDVAQVIVPAELGYPLSGDPEHVIVGPRPSTFSGQRALNFVLDNRNLIDKTLLINVKVVRIDKDYGARVASPISRPVLREGKR